MDNRGGEANLEKALRLIALLSVITAITGNSMVSKPTIVFLEQ